MKTLAQSTVAFCIFSAGLTASTLAGSPNHPALVNAYGEPAGFGNVSRLPLPETKGFLLSGAISDVPGYLLPGSVYNDRQSYESIGSRQSRAAGVAQGTVTIGPLEVLDSGPTGPLAPELQTAARDEVTTQVLVRIKETDKVMSDLRSRAKDLDRDTWARFKSAADEVAAHRNALREDLKTVRAADGSQWGAARSEVAVSFNAYVESMHRAEAIVSIPSNS